MCLSVCAVGTYNYYHFVNEKVTQETSKQIDDSMKNRTAENQPQPKNRMLTSSVMLTQFGMLDDASGNLVTWSFMNPQFAVCTTWVMTWVTPG